LGSLSEYGWLPGLPQHSRICKLPGVAGPRPRAGKNIVARDEGCENAHSGRDWRYWSSLLGSLWKVIFDRLWPKVRER